MHNYFTIYQEVFNFEKKHLAHRHNVKANPISNVNPKARWLFQTSWWELEFAI